MFADGFRIVVHAVMCTRKLSINDYPQCGHRNLKTMLRSKSSIPSEGIIITTTDSVPKSSEITFQ